MQRERKAEDGTGERYFGRILWANFLDSTKVRSGI
jgi:hypothetical protein